VAGLPEADRLAWITGDVERVRQLVAGTLIGSLSDVLSPTLTTLVGLQSAAAVAYASELVTLARAAAAEDDNVSEDEALSIDRLRSDLRAVIPAALLQSPAGGSASPLAPVSALDELEAMVGLAGVKKEVRCRVDWFGVSHLRRNRGLAATDQTMHMAFLGPPGTGKTTVARLVGKLLAELGVLPTGQFIEADRTDLIGQHVGQTGPRVVQLVNKARGGVLFIDEAYSLAASVDTDGGAYEREALDTLVKLMEDYRHELVVILAGYTRPMLELLQANPGLSSRVPTHIVFPSYSLDELIEILQQLASGYGYHLEPDALALARELLRQELARPSFGNGRTVRSLLERSMLNQAARLAPLGELATDTELSVVTALDMPPVAPTSDADQQTPPGYL
jgi:SpoVK/Ycf46/Vps4 family AAA+-type ATPase